MRRALLFLLGAAALAGAAAGGGYFWLLHRLDAPGPLGQPATVLLPRGGGAEALALTLGDAGVIEHPLLFLAGVRLSRGQGPLKAGEYAFAAGISVNDVLRQLREGRTVARRLTLPEGAGVHQTLALLENETALTGDIGDSPPEGSLLPETWHFSHGDSRAGLLARMRKGMDKALADAWANRAEGLPYQTPQQALVMASIIEKETALPAERGKIAGVFVNRLRRGMKLQSDPTTIYAVTQGKGELGRPLSRADLKLESPYNTYVADGLPPGPICNPGRASIDAALRPESHDLLYFVADGTGGHAFAATLAEHNRNVQRWRDGQKAP